MSAEIGSTRADRGRVMLAAMLSLQKTCIDRKHRDLIQLTIVTEIVTVHTIAQMSPSLEEMSEVEERVITPAVAVVQEVGIRHPQRLDLQMTLVEAVAVDPPELEILVVIARQLRRRVAVVISVLMEEIPTRDRIRAPIIPVPALIRVETEKLKRYKYKECRLCIMIAKLAIS